MVFILVFILVFTPDFFKTLNSFWRWRSFFQGKVLITSFLDNFFSGLLSVKLNFSSVFNGALVVKF
ncbi:hypothetical protein [Helicobacter pylori]|uniref:hypothetical protein n=1 Tax=Helicobacter pylori TaxID=210 RepID=UPI000BEEB1F1|nr:hypothetical protein [Helicobacter pylori]OPG27505.1 hypothetical protein BGL56_01250 [Helicobacter pylori]